jgi:hypothetical protein
MSQNNQTNESEDLASDLLRGAPAIAAFLQTIGFPDCTDDDVYYMHRSKKLSFGKFGNELIGFKSGIIRQVRKLVA